VNSALATASHAMRVNLHLGLRNSPGALVFGRDVFLNVPLIADWFAISQQREQLVNESLRCQNQKHHSFDYVQGHCVLKKIYKPTKLGEQNEGPYRINQVHANGTLTIQLRPGLFERINIRRVKPYHTPT